MKKIRIIAWFDALAFALFMFLVSTGLLMYYRLPPGSGRWKTIWGWDRHQWGDFHFWVAILFLIIIGVHLLLHQKWIVSMVKGKLPELAERRTTYAILAIFSIIAIAFAPFITGLD